MMQLRQKLEQLQLGQQLQKKQLRQMLELLVLLVPQLELQLLELELALLREPLLFWNKRSEGRQLK